MLSTIKAFHGSAQDVSKYFVESYYVGQEAGTWTGQGAAALGLTGNVQSVSFLNALHGKSPVGEELVRQFAQRVVKTASGETKTYKNTIALDLCHNMSKSASIAYNFLTNDEQVRFERCMATTADKIVEFIEQNVPLARRGKNGNVRINAKLVASKFVHHVNRESDPHLHMHVVLANMCLGDDGKWSKLDTSKLHTWTPTIGRIARATMARELIKEFGFELFRPKSQAGKELSWFELQGVPKEFCESMSNARKKVLLEAGEGGVGPGAEAAKQRSLAHHKTRNAKDSKIDLNEVMRSVVSEGKKYGFNREVLESLLGKASIPSKAKVSKFYEAAMEECIQRLTESQAYFSDRQLIQEVVEAVQHLGVDGCAVARQVMDELPERVNIIELQEVSGERRFTTATQWNLEKRLIDDVQKLRRARGALVKTSLEQLELSESIEFSDEQREAYKVAVSGSGAIRVITGEAGTGKSTVLKYVKEAFEKASYNVHGAALAGATAQDLQAKTGIESRTVASYLHRLDKSPLQQYVEQAKHDARMLVRDVAHKPIWKKTPDLLGPKSVLIVDEAGMLSSKELGTLVRIVRNAGATLLLVGDTEQLPAIGAGTPLGHIMSENAHAHLEVNYRQADKNDVEAIKAVRKGDIKSALENYAKRDRIHVGDQRVSADELLIDWWLLNNGHQDPSKHVILTQTKADAKRLNTICQKARLSEYSKFCEQRVLHAGNAYHSGDRVLFHRAIRSKGIENGHFGRVVRSDPKRNEFAVWLERPRTREELEKGLAQTVTIKLDELEAGQLTLGYAATTHKLQGATVDNCYVLLDGPMTSKQMAYVQLSRARTSTHLFVSEKLANENFEVLARVMKRDQSNRMAHEIGMASL